jgi:hypothetical protein
MKAQSQRRRSLLDNGSVNTFPRQPNPVTAATDTHATTEELLVLRVLRQTSSESEVSASLCWWVVANSGQARLGSIWPGVAATISYETVGSRKDMTTEAEEYTVLGALTKQRLMKTQQTEKT